MQRPTDGQRAERWCLWSPQPSPQGSETDGKEKTGRLYELEGVDDPEQTVSSDIAGLVRLRAYRLGQ